MFWLKRWNTASRVTKCRGQSVRKTQGKGIDVVPCAPPSTTLSPLRTLDQTSMDRGCYIHYMLVVKR